jgi:hypothetical protein
MLYGVFLHILLILSVALIVLLSYKLFYYIMAIRNGLLDIKRSEKELIDKFKIP